MLQTGMLIKGRYEIRELIGKGGMSQVFRARDRVTGADLAIKEALKSDKKDVQTAELGLSVEGNLLKRLSNPHLPRIYDVIEENDDIMIVMDYVKGQSLDKVLAQYGPIPMVQVIEWGIQICDVFHYLHTQNPPIIYRDMKPANVILQPDGNIMLIDFGTARRWKVDANRTSDTWLIGTEGFAAPEQFGGRGQSDARTDVFCLGATMFNLVTNHSPYLKPFGITPLGDWDPAMKDCALDRIIQKCTANNPYERYQTAAELKQALIEAKAIPLKIGRSGKRERGNTKKNNGWQRPLMKVSNGESRVLPSNEKSVPSVSDLSGGNKAVQADYLRTYDGRLPIDASWNAQGNNSEMEKTTRMSSAEADSKQQEDAAVWRILAIVGSAAGMILLILSVVMMFPLREMIIGGILAGVAVLVAALGVVSIFQYVRRS